MCKDIHFIYFDSINTSIYTDHNFTKFVAFGPDVVHEHLVRSQLILDGQRVVLTLLDLLKFDSFTKVPHHLNPEPSLTEKANFSRDSNKIPQSSEWIMQTGDLR